MDQRRQTPEGLDFIRESMAEAVTAPQPLPVRRIMEKLDSYMARADFTGAEQHLRYWLAEARATGDRRGELTVRNEMIGFYRKTGAESNAMESGEAALALLKELEDEESISAGTTFVNFGTACNAFGRNSQALSLFNRAKTIYEAHPGTPPELQGGLYNNMGLALHALGRPVEALDLFGRALEAMKKVPHGELEQAITLLNMADAVETRDGLEQGEGEIFALLDRAAVLLDNPDLPRDSYYAFVCDKCAPVFSYYGYFLEAQKLQKAVREIHERT